MYIQREDRRDSCGKAAWIVAMERARHRPVGETGRAEHDLNPRTPIDFGDRSRERGVVQDQHTGRPLDRGGLGGGAAGFNRGQARVGSMRASFRCIGGVDVDPAGIRDFEQLAGVPGTVIDLFDREQFTAFHGREPGPDWREATTTDIHRAAGGERPHIVFLSAPCKGFSGLLAEKQSGTAKYQALNGLTLRGVFLMLEAWSDDPPELIVFENVPRIMTRGRALLDRIGALLRNYGYAVAETTHDCGEIGGLAQSRKRFLLVARHRAKVPPFLYEPMKLPLRGVGEVLGKLPLPGDIAAAGPMHRIPSLQWRTWVRLAFVEAGKDWRSLNRLRVGEDGTLLDFAIAPTWRGPLGVVDWREPAGTIAGASRPYNGGFSVADPRGPNVPDAQDRGRPYGKYPVSGWAEHAGAVIGGSDNSAFAVADPRREDGRGEYQQYGVRAWEGPTGAVSGQSTAGGGAHSVADPRHHGPAKHCNEFRIVPWAGHAGAISGAHGSGAAVQDPRGGADADALHGKYRVTDWSAASRAVIAGRDNGASVVADPRMAQREDYKQTKYKVTGWGDQSGAVIAASTTGNGAFAVQDPRAEAFKGGRATYTTQGHYGVTGWAEPSAAVVGYMKHDRGKSSVADPRTLNGLSSAFELPAPETRMICRIEALDGTWHRPFTTLELAALQSLFDPDQLFTLDGISDSAHRERIGNAVPRDAATAIASTMGRTLLLAWSGQSFMLSSDPIWVQPITMALAVDVPIAAR